MPASAEKPSSTPLQVIVGEEPFLREEAIEAFRRASGAPGRGALNAEEFDLGRSGKEAVEPIEGLLEAARTLPMLAKVRWVHGRNLDALPAKHHPALLAYCASPSPKCVLLLSAAKLDGRWKLSQALRSLGVVQQVEAPKARDLASWVQQRGRALGVPIGGHAAQALAQRTGSNFGLLATALETLRTYAGPAPTEPLSAADVEAIISPTRDAHVFELTAALGRRDWPGASGILQDLLAGGESPLLVLTMLARQLRLLLGAKRWHGASRDLAENLGVRPFVADALLQEARRFTPEQLMGGLRAAQACDTALKTSALPPSAALERVLWTAMGTGTR